MAALHPAVGVEGEGLVVEGEVDGGGPGVEGYRPDERVERGGVEFEVRFGPGVRAVGIQRGCLVRVGDAAGARGGFVDVQGA